MKNCEKCFSSRADVSYGQQNVTKSLETKSKTLHSSKYQISIIRTVVLNKVCKL